MQSSRESFSRIDTSSLTADSLASSGEAGEGDTLQHYKAIDAKGQRGSGLLVDRTDAFDLLEAGTVTAYIVIVDANSTLLENLT